MASASSNKKSRIAPSSSSNTELDRISDLPGNVLDQILSNLWIKDAVKTSVLSTKWRYKYAKRASLVFDDSLFPVSSPFKLFIQPDYEIEKTNKLVSLIDRALFLHSGPIHKFGLSVRRKLPTEEIEKWILFLSRRRDLKVLVFIGYIHVKTPFHMSSSLFSCQSLTDLDLGSCSLLLPSTFGGFKNLKNLCLRSVVVCEAALERLISSSPMLERLTVSYCEDLHRLCINAPNIQHLTIKGCFIHLSLENTPHLAEFSIETSDKYVEFGDEVYLKKLLAGMPQIQRLEIRGLSLHCLSIVDFPRDIEVSPVKLHHVSIGVHISEFKETLYLLYLLNLAPNLQELHIQSMDILEPSSNSWEYNQYMNGPFTRLRYLKLNGIQGSKAEMDFISFMLLTSPALEIMTIHLSTYERSLQERITQDQVTVKVMKQLLLFGRVSPNLKIIIS